jgi:hypothetical protein
MFCAAHCFKSETGNIKIDQGFSLVAQRKELVTSLLLCKC